MSSSRLCSPKCWNVWPQCARLTKGNQIKCGGLQCAVKAPQGVFSYVCHSYFPSLYWKVSCVCVLYFKVLSFVFLFRISRRCIAVCLAKPKCLLVSAGGSQAIASLTFPCQQLLTPQQSASFHLEIYHLLVFLAFSFLSVHFLVFFCQQAPNNSAVYWNSLPLAERYCRSLIKVKFPTDQIRPALGSCCRLIDCC